MTDKEFMDEIFNKTGKVLGDFGFIAGTHTPYGEDYVANKFITADRKPGFRVWKRNDTAPDSYKDFVSEGIEKNLENIINFLNG